MGSCLREIILQASPDGRFCLHMHMCARVENPSGSLTGGTERVRQASEVHCALFAFLCLGIVCTKTRPTSSRGSRAIKTFKGHGLAIL